MSEVSLQRQIDWLEKELSATGDYYKTSLLDLRSEIDRLKLGISALQIFLEEAIPDFAEKFMEIRTKTMQELDPEFE